MRKVLVLALVFCVFVVVSCGEKIRKEKMTLKLEKEIFSPGEEIRVRFTARSSFDRSAWIGIVPSNIPHGSESKNDENDLTYEYIENKVLGTMVFKAPVNQGSYDIRMHDTDNDGKEMMYVSFEVKRVYEGVTLKLDKTTFSPGEKIKVHFTAPAEFASSAWIGIIPSSIPHGNETKNDEHDIGYRYIEKKTSGTMIFTAPGDPGKYDFRMHDTDANGVEVTSITFEVK